MMKNQSNNISAHQRWSPEPAGSPAEHSMEEEPQDLQTRSSPPCWKNQGLAGGGHLHYRHRRRPAYILLIVLGLTAVVTTLGWAFLDANGTAAPEAVNWAGAIRAEYLAESGISLATHFLSYPPTTVACGGYWTGASNVAIDATSDYVNITVTQSATDKYQFTITAVGVAHDADGSIRGKHTCTAQVLRAPAPKWSFCQALVGTAPVTISSQFHVVGDIFANGALTSLGWCQGNVSAAGLIVWLGGGPPASLTPWASPITLPAGTLAKYTTYNLGGSAYTAYTYSKASMGAPDATALNALSWPTTNPGRIIYHLGTLTLNKDVVLNGTLVVDGDLKTNGTGVQITAVQDYPAAVISGALSMAGNNDITFNGSVICPGGISDMSKTITVTINGTCFLGTGSLLSGLATRANLNWDASRSTFWDLENGSGVYLPVTILSWQDN